VKIANTVLLNSSKYYQKFLKIKGIELLCRIYTIERVERGCGIYGKV